MTKRRRIYAVAIVLLLLVYGWKFVFVGVPKVRVNRDLDRIAAAEDELGSLQRELARKQARIESLKQRASEYWSAKEGVTPLNDIQKTVLRIGKSAGIDFSYVGTPIARVVNEHLRTVDITIRATTNVQALQRFLEVLTAQRPRLQIETSNLRPDSVVAPKSITFDGKIRAYVVDSEVLSQIKEAL